MQGYRQGRWTQEYLRDPLPPTTCLFNSPGEQLSGIFWGTHDLQCDPQDGKVILYLWGYCFPAHISRLGPLLVLKDPVISEWAPHLWFHTLRETSLITHNDDPPSLVLTVDTECCSLSHYHGNGGREWMCTSQTVQGKRLLMSCPRRQRGVSEFVPLKSWRLGESVLHCLR